MHLVRNGFRLFLFIGIILLTGCASSFGERPDVQAFIQHVSQQDNFNQEKLTALFNQVHPREIYVSHTQAPQEKTASWSHYRAIFITRERINDGVQFWREHERTLQKAQREYGVDPAIIVGIIGVETEYGKFMGNDRVMDSLSTLAFNYPPREAFFKNELEQYLLLTREMHVDPMSLYGSYAGAVGLPQFMPSSYRSLAVSDTPGQMPNLWNNPDDAILSVANYFHQKGWYFNKRPAVPSQRCYRHDVMFGDQCWHLYHNFYVIMRYNDSTYYAMAVYQLANAIRQEKNA